MKKFSQLIPILLLVLIWIALTPLHNSDDSFNVDAYYHFSVSRMMSEQGLLTNIPQVDNTEWKNKFLEKEFLFHIFTTLGYKFALYKGVWFVTSIFSLSILIVMFFILTQFTTPLRSFIILIFMMISCETFMLRIYEIRPHVLAVLLFLLILTALVNGNNWLSFIGGTLFSLSYHGIFAPLSMLGIYAICSLPLRKKDIKLILYSFSGISFGVIINPYFPENLSATFMHMNIVFQPDIISQTFIAFEFIPLSFGDFISAYKFHLSALIMGIILLVKFHLNKSIPDNFRNQLGRNRRELPTLQEAQNFSAIKNTKTTFNQLTLPFLLLCSIVFFILTLKNHRGSEYWVPVTTILAGCILGVDKVSSRQFFSLAGVLLIISLPAWISKDSWRYDLGSLRNKSAIESLNKINAASAGKKILNVPYDIAPYILYYRPDLKFVDILDPQYLNNFAPDLSENILLLSQRKVFDPYFMVKNIFNADFVMSHAVELNLQLEMDPRFVTLYPTDRSIQIFKGENGDDYVATNIRLYKVVDNFDNVFIKKFEILKFDPGEEVDTKNNKSEALKRERWEQLPFKVPSPSYIQIKPDSDCIMLKPIKSEKSYRNGALYLGIGGNSKVEVFLNRFSLSVEEGAASNSIINRLVKLPMAFSEDDRLEFRVCNKNKNEDIYLSLSMWKQEEIDDYCGLNGGWNALGPGQTISNYSNIPINVCVSAGKIKSRNIISSPQKITSRWNSH